MTYLDIASKVFNRAGDTRREEELRTIAACLAPNLYRECPPAEAPKWEAYFTQLWLVAHRLPSHAIRRILHQHLQRN